MNSVTLPQVVSVISFPAEGFDQQSGESKKEGRRKRNIIITRNVEILNQEGAEESRSLRYLIRRVRRRVEARGKEKETLEERGRKIRGRGAEGGEYERRRKRRRRRGV